MLTQPRATRIVMTFCNAARDRALVVADRHAMRAMRLFAGFATFSKYAFYRVANSSCHAGYEGDPSYQWSNTHTCSDSNTQEAFQC